MANNTRVVSRQLPDETEPSARRTDAGGISSHVRESAPEGTLDQGRLLDQQEPPPTRTGETTRGVLSDAHRSNHNIAVVFTPEEEPLDVTEAEHIHFENRTRRFCFVYA